MLDKLHEQNTKGYNLLVIKENFKRIHALIELTWGTPECVGYMNSILLDSRDGERRGFPVDVAGAIMQLIRVHNEEHPYENQSDIWSKV